MSRFLLIYGPIVALQFMLMLPQQVLAETKNFSEWERTGLRGDPQAIAAAQELVEAMGGKAIWAQLKSVHFVHEWDIASRVDRYLENEILDFTGVRSWVTMESEIYQRTRAYSPEYKYWNIVNGEFSYAPDGAFEAAAERAPYSIYRLANAIASGNSYYSVRLGEGPGQNIRVIEFLGPDDAVHGSVTINARNEPVLWSTTQYTYSFGPMERYGNLRVPKWAGTSGGLVTYETVSLTGSNKAPGIELFAPPEQFRDRGER